VPFKVTALTASTSPARILVHNDIENRPLETAVVDEEVGDQVFLEHQQVVEQHWPGVEQSEQNARSLPSSQDASFATSLSGGALLALWLGLGLATGRLQLPSFFAPSENDNDKKIKVVLDTAEQNWLAALRKHTTIEEGEEYGEEENFLLAALYPPLQREESRKNLSEDKSERHFFCCNHPGQPVECLPHDDWHIRRDELSFCSSPFSYDISINPSTEADPWVRGRLFLRNEARHHIQISSLMHKLTSV